VFQCVFCAMCVVQVCFVLEGSVILLISVLASYSLFWGIAVVLCKVSPEGRPGMYGASPLCGISGLSFNFPFLSLVFLPSPLPLSVLHFSVNSFKLSDAGFRH